MKLKFVGSATRVYSCSHGIKSTRRLNLNSRAYVTDLGGMIKIKWRRLANTFIAMACSVTCLSHVF